MTRILELSSREPEPAEDVVDLGNSPGMSSTDHDRLTPTPTYTYSNGTNGSYTDSTGYSKVSNMKGLVGNLPEPEEGRRQSCCS